MSGSRVGRNALAGTVAQVVSMALSLLTTPAQFHALGPVAYGALALVGSLTAYVGILDFGIGSSLTRYMSYHQERGDQHRVDGIATFGVAFYLAMAAILLPLLLLAAPAISRFLSLTPDLSRQFPILLAAFFGLFIASSLNGVLVARLAALHRLDIAAWSSMTGWIIFAAMVVLLLPRYPFLLFMVLCSAAQIAISALLMSSALFALTRRLPLRLARLPRTEVRQLFNFGLWVQLSNVTAVVNMEADKAIISHNLGVGSVTNYQVANRIALLNRSLPLQFITAMLPDITARISRGITPGELADVYARSLRMLMLATLTISGFVAAAADPILRFWLGADVPHAAALTFALVVSYAVNNATGVGTTVIKAQGRPRLETLYGAISAVLNVGMTIALIGPFGLYGVVAGTIFGNVAGSLFFILVFHRTSGIGWWASTGRWLVPLLVMTGAAMTVANLVAGLMIEPGQIVRLALLGPLVASGLAYCATFFAAGAALRFWRADDMALLGPLRRLRPLSGASR